VEVTVSVGVGVHVGGCLVPTFWAGQQYGLEPTKSGRERRENGKWQTADRDYSLAPQGARQTFTLTYHKLAHNHVNIQNETQKQGKSLMLFTLTAVGHSKCSKCIWARLLYP